ncbi:MAG: hypothetical protein JRI89_14935 [Deltaproteobacteria bacterium]|nr:hypothetical protein [Deltaproteobacteria bacterium]
MLTTCFIYHYRPLFLGFGLLCLLTISFSALCIRQHYVIDVLTGYALAIVVFLIMGT